MWQPGSTIPGPWEQANTGLGVGGSGKDPSAPVAKGSTDRAGEESAPYQPWAAQKVVESFNKRGIEDPTARCLPPGVPRLNSFGLFPVQIVQTPQQVVFLYEYMNVFRVMPFRDKHPDDLTPSYLGDSIARWVRESRYFQRKVGRSRGGLSIRFDEAVNGVAQLLDAGGAHILQRLSAQDTEPHLHHAPPFDARQRWIRTSRWGSPAPRQ